jgi:hypothetical protein
MKTTATYRLGQVLAEALAEDINTDQNWRFTSERTFARTCVVAGVLDDGANEASIRGEQLRKGNSESKAVKLEGKRHAWNLQDPDLFGQGIETWMEHEPLPKEFIAI